MDVHMPAVKGARAMPNRTDRGRRWLDAWLHSDLVGIPVTLAGFAIIAVSFAFYLLIGNVAGVVVGKTFFVLAVGGLLGLILLINGRRGETTEGLSRAPAGASRRVLVVANEGLDSEALFEQVRARRGLVAPEAMIVVPVVASSPLHVLTDDVDTEVRAAQERLDDAVERLRAAGVTTTGHVDIAAPRRCLLDGLREFSATEVVIAPSGEHGWRDAHRLAEHVTTELGLPILELPRYAAHPAA
jgi:hypothetical protein